MIQLRANPVLRKLGVMPLQLVGAVRNILSSDSEYLEQPPALVNSFPKSGTHLLLQVVQGLPGVLHYGNFLASKPSITFRKRPVAQELRKLGRVCPGEALPAHLFFSEQFEEVIESKNTLPLFIYRDLRDVVVSEAIYLTEMNRWHRMHRYFANLKTMESRISLAINGLSTSEGLDYGNIRQRFENYAGWLLMDGCHPVRFEDLVGGQRRQTIRKLAQAYLVRLDRSLELEPVVDEMEARIDPEKSHTFRKGGVGEWQSAFSERNKEEMKQVAGQLLIDLKYAQDMNW